MTDAAAADVVAGGAATGVAAGGAATGVAAGGTAADGAAGVAAGAAAGVVAGGGAGGAAGDGAAEGDEGGWSNVSWTEEPRFAPVPREDAQPADDELEPSAQQPDWGTQSDDQQDDDLATDEPAWGVEAREDDPAAPEQQQGPLWTTPSQDDATQEQPVWNANNQPAEQYQLWGETPQQPDTQQPGQDQAWGTNQQPAQQQKWGAEQQPTNQQESWPQQEQSWGSPQQPEQAPSWPDQQAQANGWGTPDGSAVAGADNGWGASAQQAAPDANSWSQQNDQQATEQTWAGQSWPVQQSDPQQTWSAGQENGQQAWAGVQQYEAQQAHAGGQGAGGQGAGGQAAGQQGWAGGQGSSGQQAWGETPQRAWGDDGNESWGGQTDLSSGVGKREKEKKPKGSGGGGPLGGKLPLVIAGGLALVMLVVAAIYLITSGDDKTADPKPTGTPTQASPTPTNQSSTKPGQSKNPKLHEGDGRISSDAISFPRRNPPWSDHKLFVRQVLDSSGQRIVLQRDVNGTDDWTADIFVGALGTGSGFNGDPKATAAALAIQLRTNMYGDIPATYQTVANGAVKKSGKSGWFFKQSVTATSAAVTDRVLTLTVAVFDLGDGTAVAYVSGIPTNRPDLRTAETQAYQGINVG
ncbi:hypothetical protein [Kribbella hippodromi]